MAKQRSTPRGLRDEANVGPDPRQARHLVPLKDLGKFTVAADDPDIRGWTAFTSTGREVGRVDELLVDTSTNEVVMLDIDLRRDDRHTLAPLRAAWIDHAARRVVIDARELGDAELPSLSRQGALSDDEVRRFDEGYGRAYGSYADERELRVRRADEELRFGRRADDRLGDRTAAPVHDRDRDGIDDRAERAAAPRPHDLDRDGVDDRAERAAASARRTDVRDANDRHANAAPDRDRDGIDDRAERAAQGDALRYRPGVERHRADPDAYRVADAGERQIRVPRRSDEMIVERRPYVEEVVVRRRAADDPAATDRAAQDLDRNDRI